MRKELLIKSSVSIFLEKIEFFLDAYRVFEQDVNTININNPNDGIKAIQFTVNFYAATGRDFYLRNKSTIESRQLNELLEKINTSVNYGTINSPENSSGKLKFRENILSFLSEWNNQTLKTN